MWSIEVYSHLQINLVDIFYYWTVKNLLSFLVLYFKNSNYKPNFEDNNFVLLSTFSNVDSDLK